MRVLLDTHAFLWAASDVAKLSPVARATIEDPDNERFLSLASTWEMSIKFGIGKLSLPQPVDIFIPTQLINLEVTLLTIELPHVLRVAKLPLHHRDPFDRLLVAQALTANLPLLSADNILDAYGLVRVW